MTISKDYLRWLEERNDELQLLENAGVDNWEWYGDALSGKWDE